MNSKTLYDLTKPLFEKHPSANPTQLAFLETGYWVEEETNEYHCSEIRTDSAALIIQGHLTKWLADHEDGIMVAPEDDPEIPGYNICDINGDKYLGSGPTLIEALIAACLKVE